MYIYLYLFTLMYAKYVIDYMQPFPRLREVYWYQVSTNHHFLLFPWALVTDCVVKLLDYFL